MPGMNKSNRHDNENLNRENEYSSRKENLNVSKMKQNVLKNGLLALCALTAFGTTNAFAGNEGGANSKRELILSVLDQSKPNKYVPAAFFLHFEHKLGSKAVQDHINFFRATNMDIVKIQYEVVVPHLDIKTPKDWSKVPVYDESFFEPQLEVIEDLARELKGEALILPTVYSPVSLLFQTVGEGFIDLVKKDPEAARPAFENITQSIENYLRAARKRGADGFYVSSQGGDTRTFGKTEIFNSLVRAYDKRVSETANELASFNILHICDYGSSYVSLDEFADYPASIINPPIHLEKGSVDLKHVQEVFKRPVFGGLDRLGVIATGTLEEAKAEVDKVLENAPDNFILGADCTVPSDTDYDKLRAVIDYAHNWRTTHASAK
jgi:uroporphyrinogen decarboxylase